MLSAAKHLRLLFEVSASAVIRPERRFAQAGTID
jgi:hypothetical protein